MMQSNSEFIPNFAKLSSKLRLLTTKNTKFSWNSEHQETFQLLINEFKKETMLQYFDMGKQTYLLVDAHQTGLGAMIAQGPSIQTARPVAIASRTTNSAEKRYPQIDLEALGIDFALRRFRNYIVGSPTAIQVITDHKPLEAIFNGKRKGSIRTDRIKLRHQDIRFTVIYQRGKINQADYLSRHAKPIDQLPVNQQKEAEDLNNLLYMLHTTPIMDHISIAAIARETSNDTALSYISNLVQSGKTWIPKDAPASVIPYKSIMHELTLTGNGILLKDERIVLPGSLQLPAIELSHRGAHPGQSGLDRRMRYHFYFPNMKKMIADFVTTCKDCNAYVDKKTKEPIVAHKVPDKCWETLAVDLFGPMPSNKHVVVVQRIYHPDSLLQN